MNVADASAEDQEQSSEEQQVGFHVECEGNSKEENTEYDERDTKGR